MKLASLEQIIKGAQRGGGTFAMKSEAGRAQYLVDIDKLKLLQKVSPDATAS